MRKTLIVFLMIFFAVLAHVCAQEQQKRFMPSYEEGAEYVNEHPDKVLSVYPYFNTWKNSVPTVRKEH